MPVGSKTLLVALHAAVLVAAAAACSGSSSDVSGGDGGSSSGSGSSSGGGTSAMQACADSAHASCTQRDKCSLNGYLNNQAYGGEMNCEARTETTCVLNLGGTGTGQTPATLEACVAVYPSYTCSDYFDANPPPACVVAGTLATGSPCGANAQCQSSFCAIGAYAICGTCQPLPAAGATCQVNADCGRDLDCVKPTGSNAMTMGACAEYVASGGACLTGTAPCQNGYSCVGDNETAKTMGSCQASGQTVGAPCDGSRKTAASCEGDLGLACIPTAKGSSVGTCQAITLVGNVQPCGDLGAAPITGYASCQQGFCQMATPTATSGTCTQQSGDNGPCSTDPTTPPCGAPAKCVPTAAGSMMGTCTLPDAAKCM